MKKAILIGLLILCTYQLVLAQYDTIVNSFQKDFDEFKQSIEQEHQQFINKNDSVFDKFLKDSWEEFDVIYHEKPTLPKPVVQPEFDKAIITPPIEIEISPIDSTRSKSLEQGSNPEKAPAKSYESGGSGLLNFDFYGEKTMALHPGQLPTINRINSENINYYFRNTAKLSEMGELVKELRLTQQKLHLNDWGYYKLVQKVAESVESEQTRQILFTWVAMLKSGYNVKAGYTMDETFLLLPASDDVYLNRYYTINDIKYYIQSSRDKNKPFPKMKIHTNKYPESRNISLQMNEVPLLGQFEATRKIVYKSDTLKVLQNKILMNFFNDYPLCELGVYFNTPISENNLHQLNKFFLPKFEGKSEQQKVEILLDFVQNAFTYQADNKQFGREKYLFADELLFYPFSDCEDRAVFFSRLVKHFTHFECVGLDFPGHVNTAILFDEDMNGAFIKVNNSVYTICDPTFKGAPIGYLGPKFNKQNPKIISLN